MRGRERKSESERGRERERERESMAVFYMISGITHKKLGNDLHLHVYVYT